MAKTSKFFWEKHGKARKRFIKEITSDIGVQWNFYQGIFPHLTRGKNKSVFDDYCKEEIGGGDLAEMVITYCDLKKLLNNLREEYIVYLEQIVSGLNDDFKPAAHHEIAKSEAAILKGDFEEVEYCWDRLKELRESSNVEPDKDPENEVIDFTEPSMNSCSPMI